MTVATVAPAQRAWLGLALLVVPTLLVAVDINAVFLAMPKLSVDLHATGTQQLWITDAYGYLVAGCVIPMGAVADRIGRRRTLVLACSAFGALSALAAYAPSAEALIGYRLLLGVAGASLMPCTLALITTMFPDERRRGIAITIWSTSMFGGAALGPVLGGLLLDAFWWGSVFVIAAPLMAVVVALAPAVLPEPRHGDGGRIDVPSVVLCLAAILPLAWAVKQLAAPDVDVLPVLGVTAAGLVCAMAFVRRQRRQTVPMLQLDLLANRRVAITLVSLVVTGACLAGLGWVTTQYLQSVSGLSPLAAAVAFAPMGLGLAAGCTASPLLARRFPAGRAIAAGLAVSLLGFLPALLAGGPVALVTTDALVALGCGPLFALGAGLIVGGVAPERAGSAAALAEVSNYLGGTVGLTVFGTIAAATYRGLLGPAPAAARESVARATTIARTTPGASGQHLLAAAHHAFAGSVGVVALTGAVVFAALVAAVTHAHRADRG